MYPVNGTDTSDKDSPNGIVLTYVFHMPEALFKLPIEEYRDAIERQLSYMKHQLVDKAMDHYTERAVDTEFPTEFTRP